MYNDLIFEVFYIFTVYFCSKSTIFFRLIKILLKIISIFTLLILIVVYHEKITFIIIDYMQFMHVLFVWSPTTIAADFGYF